MQADDSPAATNKNNIGPAYSFIKCYNGFTVAHELGHNLGGVQDSAPHTSGAGHCYEEWDLMCYQDGGPYFQSGGVIAERCPASSGLLVDCGGDDYYNSAPAAGTYLATHWNTARSAFLTAPRAVGDINGDRHVDCTDVHALVAADGSADPASDLNHDGTVGSADMAILLAHWTGPNDGSC
jgi:hypothetical protein